MNINFVFRMEIKQFFYRLQSAWEDKMSSSSRDIGMKLFLNVSLYKITSDSCMKILCPGVRNTFALVTRRKSSVYYIKRIIMRGL